MNTGKSREIINDALLRIPSVFRNKMIKYYKLIREEHSRGHFDSSGLNAGKFCETILRFLQSELTNNYIKFNKKIDNYFDECAKLKKLPKSSGIESIRIVIPRALEYLYTLRNKRGIGHVGGDVDANKIDSTAILRTTDWIICELIRIKHNLSLEEAQDIVNSISSRILPDIWEVAGRKIVIKHNLNTKQKVLLLCYSCENEAILSEDLYDWSKYSNYAVFKNKILKPLDKDNLIFYDQSDQLVYLSPLGIKEVEEKII